MLSTSRTIGPFAQICKGNKKPGQKQAPSTATGFTQINLDFDAVKGGQHPTEG